VRSAHGAFAVRVDHDAVIVSFSAPARALSWALLNGGFCRAEHVINRHIGADNADFRAAPGRWLEQATSKLGLQGKIVAMATAVTMEHLVQVSFGTGAEVTCFATVGCGNALSVGDPAAAIEQAAPVHTINMIVIVRAGLTDEALVEAIQIATEGRVRALREAEIRSSVSSLTATGTGTDCIAVAALGADPARYCGKHTKLGELIGMATYSAVKRGLLQENQAGGAAGGNSHEA
jgi:adenosylcobinamide amidohydrolase